MLRRNTLPKRLGKRWTEKEETILRELRELNYEPWRIADYLDRTSQAVIKKTQAMKIGYMTHKPWTRKEEERVKSLWDEGYSARMIGEIIGRSTASIKCKVKLKGWLRKYANQQERVMECLSH